MTAGCRCGAWRRPASGSWPKACIATRLTQELFAQTALARTPVRLFQVLGGSASCIETYAAQDGRLREIEAQLAAPAAREPARSRCASSPRCRRHQRADAAMRAAVHPIRQPARRFRAPAAARRTRSPTQTNTQIDAELNALRTRTQRAQRQLFWVFALLIPLTVVAIARCSRSRRSAAAPDRSRDQRIGQRRAAPADPGPRVRSTSRSSAASWNGCGMRLLDLAQERNRFLRHMSHELKTPLANIREGTELLMDGAVGELQSGQREVTGILRENGLRLQRMIENLLSFSAWQTSSVGLEISEFRLRPLIKQIIENQQLALLSQRVRLDVQCRGPDAARRSGEAAADTRKPAVQRHQVLAAQRHDPRPRARRGRRLVLEVGDSGPGHPAGGTRAGLRSLLHRQGAGRPCQGHRHRPVGGAGVRHRASGRDRDRRWRMARRPFPHPHAAASQRHRAVRRSAGRARPGSRRMRHEPAAFAGGDARPGSGRLHRSPRPAAQAPRARPDRPPAEAVQAAQLNAYSATLQQLAQGSPAEQAEIIAGGAPAYEQARAGPGGSCATGSCSPRRCHPARDPAWRSACCAKCSPRRNCCPPPSARWPSSNRSAWTRNCG